MKRYRQTLDEILEHLSPVEASWRDDHADTVIRDLEAFPVKHVYTRADLVGMFDLVTTNRKRFDADLLAKKAYTCHQIWHKDRA
jgi:hypothetical protein